MEPKEIVEQIVESNNYLTLVTTNGNEPWGNAVFFAADKELNFYFSSYNNSIHVQNILQNPNVAVVIYDSHIPVGKGQGQGLQIKAKCHRVLGEDLSEAIDILYSKRFPDSEERASKDLSVEHFSKSDDAGRSDHLYKIIPEKIYILDKRAGKDTRLEVEMK